MFLPDGLKQELLSAGLEATAEVLEAELARLAGWVSATVGAKVAQWQAPHQVGDFHQVTPGAVAAPPVPPAFTDVAPAPVPSTVKRP